MELPPYPLVTHEGLQPIPLDAEILLRWQEDRWRLVESEWCAPLRHAGRPPSCPVVEGNPATVLMETAEAQPAGLIVVGRRGMGGFDELLLGSMSQQLVQHAVRPVSVVPCDGVAPRCWGHLARERSRKRAPDAATRRAMRSPSSTRSSCRASGWVPAVSTRTRRTPAISATMRNGSAWR
jgi:Universal stress protein family